MMSHLLRDFNL